MKHRTSIPPEDHRLICNSSCCTAKWTNDKPEEMLSHMGLMCLVCTARLDKYG